MVNGIIISIMIAGIVIQQFILGVKDIQNCNEDLEIELEEIRQKQREREKDEYSY